MRAYIDSEHKLHTVNDGTMTAVDVDFGGQCKQVIEAYKFFPETGTLILWDNAQKTFGMQALYAEMAEPIKNAVADLDDEHSEAVKELFPFWGSDVEYHKEDKEKGIPADRVQYGGLLYRCVQSHTSQSDWTPDITPALWVRTSTEEWPEWIQPTGAHDAYPLGAKVSHNGKHWINTGKDGNEYEPGVWGWDEVE